MTENPYQAPTAELADAPEILPPRPRAVTMALSLILGSVVLQILANVYLLQKVAFHVDHPWLLGLNGAGFLLYGFFCQQMARRRSWPRIVILVITLVVFAQLCVGLGAAWHVLAGAEMADLLPAFLVIRVIPLAMNLAAMHLLFFSSGTWFRR
jgi:hypothetical protein